jgi:hypothetical protein
LYEKCINFDESKEGKVPSLQVRELPEHVYVRLKEKAKNEHRSLAQQAVVEIEKGLFLDENPRDRKKGILDRFKVNRDKNIWKQVSRPAKLIREDRER